MTTKRPFSWRLSYYASLFFLVAIFFAVNYIGYKRYERIDYSTDRYLTLSNQTLNLLDNIAIPIKIILLNSNSMEDTDITIQEDTRRLLEEYAYRSKGKIVLERVNIFTNELPLGTFPQGFNLSEGDFLLISNGDQYKVLKTSELAELDTSGLMAGQPPTIKSFNAESQITRAILSLTSGKVSKVYFTTGHGEPALDSMPDDPIGISVLAGRVRAQNAEVAPLNLANEGIAQEADLVVILGPKTPFLANEVEALKSYLDRKGRLFLLLSPETKTGLENLLEPYGVSFDQNLVLRSVLALGENGAPRQAIALTAVGAAFADHPATAWMQWMQQRSVMFPLAKSQSISIKPAESPDKPEVIPLIQTSAEEWGETTLSNLQTQPPKFDPQTDRKGPLTLAVAVDTGSVQGGKVHVDGVKVVAVGSSDFLINQVIGAYQADFFLNAMNWMLGQEQALGITPKVQKTFAIKFTDSQRQMITGLTILLIPGLSILLGILVWMKRRR